MFQFEASWLTKLAAGGGGCSRHDAAEKLARHGSRASASVESVRGVGMACLVVLRDSAGISLSERENRVNERENGLQNVRKRVNERENRVNDLIFEIFLVVLRYFSRIRTATGTLIRLGIRHQVLDR